MAKFFISYRRQDAQYQADKLHAVLSAYVANPREDIFIDVDNIPFGRDFVAHLDSKVSDCEVLLAVIGPHWLDLRDPVTGQRLLDHPDDFVRIEIESALKRDIPVVPILLDGVSVPRASDLPENLQPLVRRNGIPVQRLTFEADVARLMQGLGYDSLNSTASGPLPRAKPKPDIAADLRQTWAAFPVRENVDAVARFLARVSAAAPGSGLEFEVEHHLNELRRAADAEEKAGPGLRRRAAEAARRRNPGTEFRDGEGLPLMVTLPQGSFRMGSPETETDRSDREGPVHDVRIGYPLAVGKYPVTVGEFRRFIEATDHETGHSAYVWTGSEWKDTPGRGWRDPGFAQDDSHPVTCVNWDDAQAYVAWAAGLAAAPYSLLSEAEWEYACRAGTKTRYAFGDEIDASSANFNNSKGGTTPVGTFPANAFGLYDMHGNVWEWTQDCWNESYSGAPKNGSAWTSGDCSRRTVRGGGSWDDDPQYLRSAFRFRYLSAIRYYILGFRVARTL